MASRVQHLRGNYSEWSNYNPTLLNGELGFETDTFKIKIGDGTTDWNNLCYISPLIEVGNEDVGNSICTFDVFNGVGRDLDNNLWESYIIGSINSTPFIRCSEIVGSYDFNNTGISFSTFMGTGVYFDNANISDFNSVVAVGSNFTFSHEITNTYMMQSLSDIYLYGSSITVSTNTFSSSNVSSLGRNILTQSNTVSLGDNLNIYSSNSVVVGRDITTNYSGVAVGVGLILNGSNQTVLGRYNESGNYAFILGGGTTDTWGYANRRNLLTIDHNGTAEFLGNVKVIYPGNVTNDSDLATKYYVDNTIDTALEDIDVSGDIYTFYKYSDGTNTNGVLNMYNDKVGKVYYKGTQISMTNTASSNPNDYNWQKICEGFNITEFTLEQNNWLDLSNCTSEVWYNDYVNYINDIYTEDEIEELCETIQVLNIGADTTDDCFIQVDFPKAYNNVLYTYSSINRNSANYNSTTQKYTFTLNTVSYNIYLNTKYKIEIINTSNNNKIAKFVSMCKVSDLGNEISNNSGNVKIYNNDNNITLEISNLDYIPETGSYMLKVYEVVDNEYRYLACGTECIYQTNNIVIFGCLATPEFDLKVNIMGDYILRHN